MEWLKDIKAKKLADEQAADRAAASESVKNQAARQFYNEEFRRLGPLVERLLTETGEALFGPVLEGGLFSKPVEPFRVSCRSFGSAGICIMPGHWSLTVCADTRISISLIESGGDQTGNHYLHVIALPPASFKPIFDGRTHDLAESSLKLVLVGAAEAILNNENETRHGHQRP